MYIRIVAERYNVLFECDRAVEDTNKLTFFNGDDIHTELLYDDNEFINVYAMNNNGKTIQHWGIYPEGK